MEHPGTSVTFGYLGALGAFIPATEHSICEGITLGEFRCPVYMRVSAHDG